jgi:amino acid permease
MEKDQHEMYEYASRRIKQKKLLYYHFTFLCLGSIFFVIANKLLEFYPDTNWWKWAIVIWVFIFLLHCINVFVFESFMNKHWERAQIDKLIQKQTQKIEQLKNNQENIKSNEL